MRPGEFKRLLSDGPLLSDGGMGTALVDQGVALGACFEEVSLTRPDLVRSVHRSFARAGAGMVETNTFGANRFALSKFGLEDRVAELNQRGVDLARDAGVLVAGSVGPLRVHLVPYGRVTRQQAFDAYAEQVGALAAAGVDLVLIETQSDLVEMEQALSAAREACDVAVVVSATFTRDDRTLLGSTPEQVARRLVELGADAIGVNCSEGPAQVLRVIQQMAAVASGTPLVAMPNAGGPQRVGDRILYPATPEYLADFARSALGAGACFVGGCCGTQPAHIEAMARVLSEPRQQRLELAMTVAADEPSGPAPSPTKLATALREGRFVVVVEMEPPKGYSVARLLAGAETLSDAGADVVYVPDGSRARLRMSGWAACRLVQEHAGVETILGFPTRGRNLLRVQADLLAAHALGIRDLFVCLGDPTEIGDFPQATGRVDVTPTGLLTLVTQSFNRGHDQSGTSIGEPTAFVAGCAVDLAAHDVDRECRVLRRKIEAGAAFALSQPVFDPAVVQNFRRAYEQRHGRLDLPIFPGVIPLLNSRNADYLHNEVPGFSIPEEVRDRMRRAGEGAEAEAEGLRIAIDLAAGLREQAAGVYLLPPFRRFDLAAEVVDAIRR
ncbi:MAG TPA: bifunctional homocysteine S-methyltransferase/methylenetetrahydrofolate reductase [Actinomycetota bacterium]|nr:bifunctional homocysteine S-methyltransferase/methylenetetrahydrofolate reductase [Actinomycetota bacterium]